MKQIIQIIRYAPKYVGIIMALVQALQTIADEWEKINDEKSEKNVK